MGPRGINVQMLLASTCQSVRCPSPCTTDCDCMYASRRPVGTAPAVQNKTRSTSSCSVRRVPSWQLFSLQQASLVQSSRTLVRLLLVLQRHLPSVKRRRSTLFRAALRVPYMSVPTTHGQTSPQSKTPSSPLGTIPSHTIYWLEPVSTKSVGISQ